MMPQGLGDHCSLGVAEDPLGDRPQEGSLRYPVPLQSAGPAQP